MKKKKNQKKIPKPTYKSNSIIKKSHNFNMKITFKKEIIIKIIFRIIVRNRNNNNSNYKIKRLKINLKFLFIMFLNT